MWRRNKIREARIRQPLKELERKAEKASRRGWFTQEDIDVGEVKGREMAQWFARNAA